MLRLLSFVYFFNILFGILFNVLFGILFNIFVTFFNLSGLLGKSSSSSSRSSRSSRSSSSSNCRGCHLWCNFETLCSFNIPSIFFNAAWCRPLRIVHRGVLWLFEGLLAFDDLCVIVLLYVALQMCARMGRCCFVLFQCCFVLFRMLLLHGCLLVMCFVLC